MPTPAPDYPWLIVECRSGKVVGAERSYDAGFDRCIALYLLNHGKASFYCKLADA